MKTTYDLGHIEQITPWAEKTLSELGYTLNKAPEDIQSTPWSYIKRFSTSRGYIYLKQTPPGIFVEVDIIQLLHTEFQAKTPTIIAINKHLHCFLMEDAGISLRVFLKDHFQADIFCDAIKQYTSLQSGVAKHINLFLDLGVPDWRLEKLPELYRQLISNEGLLIDDGMTRNDINTLHKLQPNFSSLCKQLSHYKIPETLDQCDFHDNNILIDPDTHKITLVDLGELVITHPFFSAINCLDQAVFHHALKENDLIYNQLEKACFENWRKYEGGNNLHKAFDLAKTLWPIYKSLSQHRLMQTVNPEHFKSLNKKGRLVKWLNDFMTSQSR
jgi:hypothetical protein